MHRWHNGFALWQAENYIEILQLRAKFQTAMVSCSRRVWITNSSDRRRFWAANFLHTEYSPNPLGHEAAGLGNYFVCKRFAVQTLCSHWNLLIKQFSSTTPSQSECYTSLNTVMVFWILSNSLQTFSTLLISKTNIFLKEPKLTKQIMF